MNDHVGGSRSYRKSDNDKNTIDASGKGSSGLHALAAAASQRASDFIPATAKNNTSDTSSGVHTLTLAAAASQRASASILATTSGPTSAKKILVMQAEKVARVRIPWLLKENLLLFKYNLIHTQ